MKRHYNQLEKSRQFVKLHLLKALAYKQNINVGDIEGMFSESLVELKKTIILIYNYHLSSKSIWFVGFSTQFRDGLSDSLPNHLFMSSEESFEQATKRLSASNLVLTPPREAPDLIISLDPSFDFKKISKRNSYLKIPVISLLAAKSSCRTKHLGLAKIEHLRDFISLLVFSVLKK